MRVVLVVFISQVVLIEDVLVLSNEVVHKLCIVTIILLARAGEESNDHTREEVRSEIDMVDDAVDLLVCQETLIQALVQEVVVEDDDLIDGLDLLELLFELVEVGFEHLEQHVVEVILAELEHFMSSAVRLSKHVLNIAFFGGLVDAPGFFKTILHVFLEKQVSENELVFIYDFL